jgi:hypothetical protein
MIYPNFIPENQIRALVFALLLFVSIIGTGHAFLFWRLRRRCSNGDAQVEKNNAGFVY